MPTIYKDGYYYGGGGTTDLTEVNKAIETIYNLLTDSESGTAALKVLIDSTLQNETAIKNIVNSADYGNAKIKSVIDTINTNTAANKAAITNTTYGLNALQALLTNGTYGLNALKALLTNGTYGLNALKTAISAASSGGGGSVKSVQRGDVDLRGSSSGSGNTVVKDITISSVNINKSIILVNWYVNADTFSYPVQAKIVDATTIKITAYGGSSYRSRAHWQVIEFY